MDIQQQKQQAGIILQQLGGHRFIAMTGANGFVCDETGISFGFKMCKSANKCRIILTPMDVYTVQFYKFNSRTGDCPMIAEYETVYNDMLENVFSEFTGLNTSL